MSIKQWWRAVEVGLSLVIDQGLSPGGKAEES
jgi:hypothetical protein